MKKALLFVLALGIILTLVIGSVSMVSAKSPTQVIGAGLLTYEMMGATRTDIVNFQARVIDPATAEAIGLLRAINQAEQFRATFDILYLAVSEDRTKAWIVYVIEQDEYRAKERIFEIQNDGQMSETFTINDLWREGLFYDTIQDAVLGMPDLFAISEVTATLTKVIIR